MGEPEPLVDEEFALLRTCLSTITDPRRAGTGTSPGRSVELERVGPDGPLPVLKRNPAVWRITPGSAAGVKAAAQSFRAHPGKGAPLGLRGRGERGPRIQYRASSAHLRAATPQDEGPGRRDDGGGRWEELPWSVGKRPPVGVGNCSYNSIVWTLAASASP